MGNQDLLSITEVAKRIGISRQRIHMLILNGQIKAIRLGRYYYIEASELERYIQLPQGRPHAPRSTLDQNSIDKYQ